jgi:hypothetical protein
MFRTTITEKFEFTLSFVVLHVLYNVPSLADILRGTTTGHKILSIRKISKLQAHVRGQR